MQFDVRALNNRIFIILSNNRQFKLRRKMIILTYGAFARIRHLGLVIAVCINQWSKQNKLLRINN